MQPLRIKREWPVRADAPHWRGERGESFAEAVGEWLELQDRLGRFALPAQAKKLIEAGNFCGLLRINPGSRALNHYLLTQCAMTSCVAELGMECATVAALHHALVDLVETGLMDTVAEVHKLPLLGSSVMYRIKGAICGFKPGFDGAA